jgi:hypothetical protein
MVLKVEEATENMRKNPAAFYVMGTTLLRQMSATNCKLDLRRFHLQVGVHVGNAEKLIKEIHITNRIASAEETAAMRILRIVDTPIVLELRGKSPKTQYVNQLFGPVDAKVPQEFPLEAFRPPAADWKTWLRAVGLFFELAAENPKSRGLTDVIVEAIEYDGNKVNGREGTDYMMFQSLVELFSELWHALLQPDLDTTPYGPGQGTIPIGGDAREWQQTFQLKASAITRGWNWAHIVYLRSRATWDEEARKWSAAVFRNHPATSTVSANQGSTGGKGRGGEGSIT